MSLPDRGLRFGRYELGRRIASGGMGEVFQARVTGVEGFERQIALKRIFPHLGDNQTYRRLFVREAKVMARLIHPNIVQVYDLGEENGQLYIAMEYIRGPDLGRVLAHFLEIGQRMTPTLASVIIYDVLEALDFAHNLTDEQEQPFNLVHRDISPQNVLLSSPTGVAKLCDFGVAHATSLAEDSMAGRVVGKLCYMSPEQALGEPADRRADLYAVGAILFEALAGRRVVDIRNTKELTEFARGRTTVRLAEVAPEIPRPLVAIVDRALARDRDVRYQTAAEFRDDLERFLVAGDPREARNELRTLVRQFDDTTVALTPMPPPVRERPTERWQQLETRVAAAGATAVAPVPRAEPAAEALTGPTLPPESTAVIRDGSAARAERSITLMPTSVTMRWHLAREQVGQWLSLQLDAWHALPRRTRLGAGGLFAGALVLGLVIVALAGGEPEPPPRGAAVALAADALVGPPAPVEPQVTPPVEPPPGDDPEPPVAVTPPEPEPAPRPEPAPTERPTARPTAREGYLSLNVRPWAWVFIDGKPLNKNTPLVRHPLPAGRHVVLLKAPDGRQLKTTVVITPGKTVTKILEF